MISVRMSTCDHEPELFVDRGFHGPCTAAAVAGSILRDVQPSPAPSAWVNRSSGRLPNRLFITMVAVKNGVHLDFRPRPADPVVGNLPRPRSRVARVERDRAPAQRQRATLARGVRRARGT